MAPVALALEASVKARDLAKRNGPKAPPQNLEEARQELECTLWARNCTEPNEVQVIYKTDGDGNPIQATDARGEPLFDDSGNPVFVVESEIEVPRTGLEEQTENARRLGAAEAAVVVSDAKMMKNPAELLDAIKHLIRSPRLRADLAENLHAEAHKDAAAKLADLILEEADGKSGA